MQMLTIVFRSIFKERGQELLHRCEVKAWCEEAANHFIPAGRGLPFASSAGPVPGLFRAQGGSLPPDTIVGQLGWICSHLASRPEQRAGIVWKKTT
jgi:hypothetical protein